MREGWGSQGRPETGLEKAPQTPKGSIYCDMLGLFCFLQCTLHELSAFWQLLDAIMEFAITHALHYWCLVAPRPNCCPSKFAQENNARIAAESKLYFQSTCFLMHVLNTYVWQETQCFSSCVVYSI
jgi:hypothetical protein